MRGGGGGLSYLKLERRKFVFCLQTAYTSFFMGSMLVMICFSSVTHVCMYAHVCVCLWERCCVCTCAHTCHLCISMCISLYACVCVCVCDLFSVFIVSSSGVQFLPFCSWLPERTTVSIYCLSSWGRCFCRKCRNYNSVKKWILVFASAKCTNWWVNMSRYVWISWDFYRWLFFRQISLFDTSMWSYRSVFLWHLLFTLFFCCHSLQHMDMIWLSSPILFSLDVHHFLHIT